MDLPGGAQTLRNSYLQNFWSDLLHSNDMVICPFAIYGLAHGPKTCQITYHWSPYFTENISPETAGWIYTVLSSMEKPKHVVVQHPGLVALTLDCQILIKPYQRNRKAIWHGTKGMWIYRMWDTLWGLELWPLPWPWPWIFKVKILKKRYFRNGNVD